MNKTKKTVLILYVAYVLAMAFLIYSIEHMAEPEEIVLPEVEPIEYKVELPVQIGSGREPDEVKVLEKAVSVDPDELYMLSHLLHGECGSDSCPDEMQIATGSVLLNRIESEYFPNTMKECIFQAHQYSCTRDCGGYWQEPAERTIENARWLLENGSQLPSNVIFQSQYKQGDGVYQKIGNQYYCYKEDKR